MDFFFHSFVLFFLLSPPPPISSGLKALHGAFWLHNSTQEYITETPSVLPHTYFYHLGLSDPVTLTITTKEEAKPPICSFSHHSTPCRSLIGYRLCTPNSNCQPLARPTSWFDFCRERCTAIYKMANYQIAFCCFITKSVEK